MLLSLTTTHEPATDLGYLLHKNPSRLQAEEMSFGKAYVFYPEATFNRCTVAVLLEVDPVGLVRGRRGPAGGVVSLGAGKRLPKTTRTYRNQHPLALLNLSAHEISSKSACAYEFIDL